MKSARSCFKSAWCGPFVDDTYAKPPLRAERNKMEEQPLQSSIPKGDHFDQPVRHEKLNLSKATAATEEQIADVMAYHPWDKAKIEKGELVREALGRALKVIIENVPPSADRTTAIRKLRDCRMDCNSAITHDGAF